MSQKTFNNAENTVLQSHYYLIFGFMLITIMSFLFDSIIVKQIVNSIEKVQYGLNSFFTYLGHQKSYDKQLLIQVNYNDELGKMTQL